MKKGMTLRELRTIREYRLDISRETKDFLRESWAILYPLKFTKAIFVESLRVKNVIYLCRLAEKSKNNQKDELLKKILKLATGNRRELKKLFKFLNENHYYFGSGEDLIDLN